MPHLHSFVLPQKITSVPQGQDVLVQYVDPTTGAPLGEPTRFATQADIVALQNLIAMKADTANVYSKTDVRLRCHPARHSRPTTSPSFFLLLCPKVNNMLDGKADRTVVNDLVATKADADDVYSKDDVDYMLDNKADKSTVDSLASSKADASAVYTKTKVRGSSAVMFSSLPK